MRICNRRVLGWSAFALLLAGLACALDVVLPPEPRWVVRGAFESGGITPDGKTYVTRISNGIDFADLNDAVASTEPPVMTGPVQYWDIATGKEIASVLGERGPVWQVACSSDFHQLAAIAPCANDAGRTELRWIDLAAGSERRTVLERALVPWQPRISPNGALLFLEDMRDPSEGVYLYDTASLRPVAQAKDPSRLRPSWTWSPDGNALYLCRPGTTGNASLCRVAADGETTIALNGADDLVAISPDGKKLLTWSSVTDDTFLLWDLPSGTRRGVIPVGAMRPESRGPTFTPDSRTLLITMADKDQGGTLGIWDVDSAKWLAKLPFAGSRAPCFLWPNAVVLHENEQRLSCYRLRPFAKLWQHDGKTPWAVDFFPESGRVVMLSLGDESGAEVQRRLVMSAAHGGDRLQLLDAHTGEPTLDVALDAQANHSWLSRGRHLILVTGYNRSFERGAIREFIEDNLLSPFVPNLQGGFDVSTTVRVFDIPTGTERCRFNIDHAAIGAEALTPDGETLVLLQPASPTGTAAVMCYDVPPRRLWRFILGIPSALGAVLIMGRFGWRRFRQRRA